MGCKKAPMVCGTTDHQTKTSDSNILSSEQEDPLVLEIAAILADYGDTPQSTFEFVDGEVVHDVDGDLPVWVATVTIDITTLSGQIEAARILIRAIKKDEESGGGCIGGVRNNGDGTISINIWCP